MIRGRRTTAATPVTAFFVIAVALAAMAGQPRSDERFGSVVEVTRIITEVRVVDRDGHPVPGLGPDDFRVTVSGRPAKVESASWVPSGVNAAETELEPVADSDPAELGHSPAEGRLVVLVVQHDPAPRISRNSGLLKIAPHAQQFVQSLGPRDRLALFVFGSHLQLRSDFTDRHDDVSVMLAPTEIISGELPPPSPSGPSLAAHLDRTEMRKAATMSRALELVGRALQPIEGTKSLIFVGFALGRLTAGPRVTVGDQYRRAMEALTAARTSVFALDICDADSHSLELGMRILSQDTGGFYIKTHIFPEVAVQQLARVISSYYELSVVPPETTGDRYTIKVKVKRPGTDVYVRQYYPSSYRW
ncbi:MAG: VWA domain-containing protein [Holophagae bacterium]|jgi:VWFA-related protein